MTVQKRRTMPSLWRGRLSSVRVLLWSGPWTCTCAPVVWILDLYVCSCGLDSGLVRVDGAVWSWSLVLLVFAASLRAIKRDCGPGSGFSSAAAGEGRRSSGRCSSAEVESRVDPEVLTSHGLCSGCRSFSVLE